MQQHDLGPLESLVWVEWPRAHYPSSQTFFLSQRCQHKQITHSNGCMPLAFAVDWALLMLGVFQQWVQSHLPRTRFLHIGLGQLPPVYNCDKGQSLTVLKPENESRSSDSDQGQPTVQWLWNMSAVKRQVKPGGQHIRTPKGKAHRPRYGCSLDEAVTKAKGLSLKTAPEWGGEPQQDFSRLSPWQPDSRADFEHQLGYSGPWHLLSYKSPLFLQRQQQ